MSLFRRKPPHVKRYRELRAAGKVMAEKIVNGVNEPQYDVTKAARKLTIPFRDGAFVLESETDAAALSDFYLHESPQGEGETVL